MSLAVGFPCPKCRHEVADVLEFIKDGLQILTAHRLQCIRCSAVYVETRESTKEEDIGLELLLDEAISSVVIPLRRGT